MMKCTIANLDVKVVTILILIDGFLQYEVTLQDETDLFKSQSLF